MARKGRKQRPRSSKTKNKKRFPIGEYKRSLKEVKADYLLKNDTLSAEKARLDAVETEREDICKTYASSLSCLEKERKKLQSLQNKLKRVDEKQKATESNLTTPDNKIKRKHVSPATVEKRKKLERQRQPSQTSIEDSESFSSPTTEISKRRRTKETLESCSLIHGGTNENIKPALDGMWVTLVNRSTPRQLQNYLGNSKKMLTKVIGPVVKSSTEEFEKSDDNAIRSLKVLYSKGLLSKEKYKAVRSNLTMSCNIKSKRKTAYQIMKGVRIPKLLPYEKLKKFIDDVFCSVKVYDLSQFYDDLDESFHVNGAYRELIDLLLELADLFIFIDQTLGNKSHILHFNENPYHFHVACGADGAPFGKDDEATAWLISFLNSGTHISSEKENFLLAGANCGENHTVMQRYARKLFNDFEVLETKTFMVKGFSVRFSMELFPSDMKFLASYSGELCNAAFYFSSFGNVNDDNRHITNGSLGPEPGNTWHPWIYTERVQVASEVNTLKEKLSKTTLATSTKRTKVLNFIREKKSRQEEEPLIGKYVDVGFAEPLHNANNAWQFIHANILSFCLEKSKIPSTYKDINEVPADSSFAKYLRALKAELKAGRLLKKVIKWFSNGRKGSFDYRFTGKETKALSHKFMYLIAALDSESDSSEEKLRLCAIAYCALELRSALSIFARVNIDENDVVQLQIHCLKFFNTVSTLLQRITPTVWTVGYAIPYHTRILFEKYQIGLGINSMQGREAKHVRLQQYSRHASLALRWQVVLKHDFVSSIWLRRCDPHHFGYSKCKDVYVPLCIKTSEYCFCGIPKDPAAEQCIMCSSHIYQEVMKTAALGYLSDDLKTLLSVGSE